MPNAVKEMFLLTSKPIELSEHTYACTQNVAEKTKQSIRKKIVKK